MKKLLSISLFFFFFCVAFSTIAHATVRGCSVEGPAYKNPSGEQQTTWICNPGTYTWNNTTYTCNVTGAQAAVSWSPSNPPPISSSQTSGCAPAVDFLSGGNAKAWYDPSLSSQFENLKDTQINADGFSVFNLRSNFIAAAGAMIGYPNAPQGSALKTGATRFFASSIGSMADNKPASSVEYLAYMGGKLKVPGVAQPAFAADGGYGFNSLSPILKIWTVTRNIAYMFFAVAFVIVGVMIVFGQKGVDKKTILTIQAALPNIIVALLLVTFSYAIAGFLIDLMFVLIQIIFTILAPVFPALTIAGFGISIKDLQASANGNETIFQFALRGWPALVKSGINFNDGVKNIVDSITDVSIIGATLGTGNPLTKVADAIRGGTATVASSLVTLVIAFAILYSLFKIWIKLIMAYVQIILSVISAPILIMFDALPGSNNFSNWLKNLMSNLLLFPATILLMVIAYLIMGNFGQSVAASGKDGFVPPLIGGFGNPNNIQVIIGMGMLLSIPKFLDTIPSLFPNFKNPFKDLGTAWVDPVQNNWLSQRGKEYSAVQEKIRQADMAKRMEPPKKPDMPLVPRMTAPSAAIAHAAATPTHPDHIAAQKYLNDYDHSVGVWDEYIKDQAKWESYDKSLGRRLQKGKADVGAFAGKLRGSDIGNSIAGQVNGK